MFSPQAYANDPSAAAAARLSHTLVCVCVFVAKDIRRSVGGHMSDLGGGNDNLIPKLAVECDWKSGSKLQKTIFVSVGWMEVFAFYFFFDLFFFWLSQVFASDSDIQDIRF